MFFPSFLLQVSTKNKALQDTSQAMGMKDKLVQQKSERYHFGYDSLISFPIIIQASHALGFPPWCWSVCLRLVLRIFTNWGMLKRIETPKEQLVKPSPSIFKLHISRQPSSSVFHPSSSEHGASNGHLHWHRSIFFSSESRIYLDNSRINLVVVLCVRFELEVLWPHFWFPGHGQEWLERDWSQSSTLLSLDRVNLISMACGTLVISWFLYVVIPCLYLQKHLDIEAVWNDPHVTSGKVATVYELRRSVQGAITPGNLVWFCL